MGVREMVEIPYSELLKDFDVSDIRRKIEEGTHQRLLLKSIGKYTLTEHKWMRVGTTGEPVGTRRIPKVEWLLFLDYSGEPRAFILESNPLYALPQSAAYHGRTSSKWMEYEGSLEPREAWNPNKELKSKMTIMGHGTVDVEAKRVDGEEVLILRVNSGSMRGTWTLSQEEKGSTMYTIDRTKTSKMETDYVLIVDSEKEHKSYEILLDMDTYIDVIGNIPLEFRDKDLPSVVEHYRDEDRSRLSSEGKRRRGSKEFDVKIIENGEVNIIENTPQFMMLRFFGKNLSGLWNLFYTDGEWEFNQTTFPVTKSLKILENPSSYTVVLRDLRDFSTCLSDESVKRYDIPNLPVDTEVRLCTFPRMGGFHGVKIQSITFPKKRYTIRDVQSRDYSEYLKWEDVQKRGDE